MIERTLIQQVRPISLHNYKKHGSGVHLTKSRVTWARNSTEELPTSGWPVGDVLNANRCRRPSAQWEAPFDFGRWPKAVHRSCVNCTAASRQHSATASASVLPECSSSLLSKMAQNLKVSKQFLSTLTWFWPVFYHKDKKESSILPYLSKNKILIKKITVMNLYEPTTQWTSKNLRRNYI